MSELEHDSAGWALADIADLYEQGLISEEVARRGKETVGHLFRNDHANPEGKP